MMRKDLFKVSNSRLIDANLVRWQHGDQAEVMNFEVQATAEDMKKWIIQNMPELKGVLKLTVTMMISEVKKEE